MPIIVYNDASTADPNGCDYVFQQKWLKYSKYFKNKLPLMYVTAINMINMVFEI